MSARVAELRLVLQLLDEPPLDQFTKSAERIGYDQLLAPGELVEDTDPRPDAQKSLDDYQQQLAAKRKRPKRHG